MRVVRIILGDNNLNAQDVRKALQRRTDDEALWEVFASPADLIGDNVAVCGAVATFQPIAVGASYRDRGMRNDSHDAVAVVITLRGASQPAEKKKRNIAFGEFPDNEEKKRKIAFGEFPSQPIWEMLAFTGRFDVDMLQQLLHKEPSDGTHTRNTRSRADDLADDEDWEIWDT